MKIFKGTSRKLFGALAAAVQVLLSLSIAHAQTLIPIEPLAGYSQTDANGINDSGTVVGEDYLDNDTYTAFEYSGGSSTNLGNLGAAGSEALAINNSGEVVGFSYTDVGVYQNAFGYSNGTMIDLGTLGNFPQGQYAFPIGGYSGALAINSSGEAAGFSVNPTSQLREAVTYSGGTVTPINLGDVSAGASGISNSGQVVGTTTNNEYENEAFLYSGGQVSYLGATFVDSGASAINNSSQVAGSGVTSGGVHEALIFNAYVGGSIVDLANSSESADATAINNSGQAVGYFDASNGSQEAFVYTPGVGTQDLDSLYASLLVRGGGAKAGFTSFNSATGINSSGQIIGYGNYWTGAKDETLSFILTPGTPSPVTASPGTAFSVGNSGQYTAVPSVTAQGGYGTQVSLVGGSNTTGTPQNVTLGTTTLGASYKGLASDVVTVSGNNESVFAVQLTFNLAAADQIGGASEMTLLSINDTTGKWQNTVDGDLAPNGADAVSDYQGSFSAFLTAKDLTSGSNLNAYLGSYGVDTSGDTVWAIIDHNSNFGVGSPSELPEALGAAPEPSTWAMMLGGLGLLAFWRKRARRS